MIFGAPYMLWGLIGLIVPVAIHLLSRKEQRVIKVGSIRFFSDEESVKVRRLLPTDILLLILRCLLIASMVLWLAEPKRLTHQDNIPLAYYVDPGLAHHPFVSGEISPLETSYWLQPNTPPTQQSPADTGASLNFWQLAAEIDASVRADSIVIISRPLLSTTGDFRPLMNTPFSWITLEANDSFPYSVGSFYRHDSLFQLFSDEWSMSYRYDTVGKATTAGKTVVFSYPDSMQQTVEVFRKLLAVLGNFSGTSMNFVQDESNEEADVVFWFHQDPPINLTSHHILVKPDPDQPLTLQEGASGSHIIRGHRTGEGFSIFAEDLMNVLGLYPATSMKVSDPRYVSNEQIQPGQSLSARIQNSSYQYFDLLLILACLLLLAERFFSLKQKR